VSDGVRAFFAPFIRFLVRMGVTPNAITVFGFVLSLGTAVLAGFQLWIWAFVVGFVGAFSDMFDGSVARLTGKSTRFGAFLDSNLDRFGEGLVLGGIGIAMASDGRTYAVAMIFLALTGAFLVSYTRARAEGLGIDSNKGGLFSRTERLILIGRLGLFDRGHHDHPRRGNSHHLRPAPFLRTLRASGCRRAPGRQVINGGDPIS